MPQDMTWQAMKAAEYTRESPAPWTPRDIQSRGPLSLAEWLNKWNREVTWLGLLPRLFTFQPFALQLDFWPVLTAKFLTLITTYRMIWHQLSCLFKCTSLTRDNHTIPFCDAGSAPRVKPTMSSPQSPFQHTSARKLPSWSQTSKKKKKKKSLLGEGNGNPLQYSHLGNPMYRTAWKATVHGLAKELDMT